MSVTVLRWSKLLGAYPEEKRRYFLQHVPRHLVNQFETQRYRAIMMDFDIIKMKISGFGVQLLIEDYQAGLDNYSFLSKVSQEIGEEFGEAINLVKGSLASSANILEQDTNQLASQLYGRLLHNSNSAIKKLLKDVREWNEGVWLRPLSPTLIQPGAYLFTLKGHTAGVTSVAITPDGRRAVSGSRDTTLRVWDLETGNPLGKPLRGHEKEVECVAITPDGRKAISGSEDGSVRIWDLEGKEPPQILGELPTYIRKLFPDDKSHEGHDDTVYAVAITPDGRKAVSTSHDHTIIIWDLKTRAKLHTLGFENGDDYSMVLAITCDSKYVVAGTESNYKIKRLQVWDLETGKEISQFKKHGDYVRSVAMIPDSKYVVVSGAWDIDPTLRVWDLETGNQLGEPLEGHEKGINDIHITPDGQKAISRSHGDNYLIVWDLANRKRLLRLEDPNISRERYFTSLAITPDGQKAIAGSLNTITVWNIETGEIWGRLEGPTYWISSLAVTPDGNKVVSACDIGNVTLKVARLVKRSNMLDVPSRNHHTEAVSCIEITRDQRKAISGSNDKTIKVWDLDSGLLLNTFDCHKDGILDITVSPDGNKIISRSFDYGGGMLRELIVWDLNNGKPLHKIVMPKGHNILAVTPDGRKAIFESSDKEFALLDLEEGKRTGVKLFHGGTALNIKAITPDGRKAIFESHTGHLEFLEVWDLQTGNLLRELWCAKEPDSYYNVGSVAITPDGKRAVSGFRDNTVMVWDLDSGNQLGKPLENYEPDSHIVITPDGNRAVFKSMRGDHILELWDLDRSERICILEGHSGVISNKMLALSNGYIVFSCIDHTLNIWDPDKNEIIASFTGDDYIGAHAAVQNGRTFVAGDSSGQVHILSLELAR